MTLPAHAPAFSALRYDDAVQKVAGLGRKRMDGRESRQGRAGPIRQTSLAQSIAILQGPRSRSRRF